MSSLLNNKILPLWVWIVIIAVGSLSIIGTTALITRCIIIRRRESAFVDTFGDENLPQRKVTVRRGRTVPTSNHLSLTGSKFGTNAFLEDGDDSSRAGARSKSPFEWWSTFKDRSSSRQSYTTQFTGDGSSVFGNPKSPQHPQSVYQKREYQHSTTSLSTDCKDDELVTTTIAELKPSPSQARRTPNFSRSFSSQGFYSDMSPRHQNKLSRIEEASPHTSMISTAQQSRIASVVSTKQDRLSVAGATLPRASLSSSDATIAPSAPQSLVSSKRSSSSHHASVVAATTPLRPPQAVAYRGSRSSLGQPELSTRTTKSRSSSFTALPETPDLDAGSEYWETRTDLHPVRTNSKKGNVLRKKSLKRSEMVTRVDA